MSLWDAFRTSVATAIAPAPAPPAPVFHPTFDSTAVIYMPNGNDPQHPLATPVSPMYAASWETTVRLCQILGDLRPVADMIPVVGSGAVSPVGVPMVHALKFPSGLKLNAGELAWYWVTQTYDVAERYCRQDIAEQ